MKTHSIIEPSWLPQTPVTLYSIGFDGFEFSKTLRTEKSETMWACMKIAKASATRPSCSTAAGRARSISARLRADGTDQRQRALHRATEQRQNECEMADFYEHLNQPRRRCSGQGWSSLLRRALPARVGDPRD